MVGESSSETLNLAPHRRRAGGKIEHESQTIKMRATNESGRHGPAGPKPVEQSSHRWAGERARQIRTESRTATNQIASSSQTEPREPEGKTKSRPDRSFVPADTERENHPEKKISSGKNEIGAWESAREPSS
jgi:hypothetical protein